MHIVIIGGGFAGINLALSLGKSKDYNITLVDKNNYNFFPPLIYQVATGFLEPSSISYPFRKLFSDQPNTSFRMGELLRVVPEEKKVILSNGELTFDYLVFATGAITNFFGNENVQKNAIPMKTIEDAINMRNTLLQQMEEAMISTDPEHIRKLLTIVIAGGGPTGVELSGMFAEMRNGIMRKEYPSLIGKGSEIYLIDGSEALLSPMSKQSQEDTYRDLRKMGVRIKLKSRVQDFVDDKVIMGDGEVIETKTLIWAAGVTIQGIDGLAKETFGRGGRLITNEFNQVQGYPNLYAIGDACIQTSDEAFSSGHPQVAQVAIQQGRQLAKNFKRLALGESLQPFKYFDKGSMAIIGRMKAVVDLPKPMVHFDGILAWFVWLFIHLISLITYRNRVRTLYNWMIAYFTKDQSLRMIIRPARRVKPKD